MNDEINKILEEMKSIIDTGKDINGIKVDGYGFHGRDLKLLYDYITNLKEENEDYKSRVEKAVEYIKLYASYDNNFCLDYHELNNLLNILQSGSDEE